MSELGRRIAFAVVAVPASLLIVYAGGAPLAAMVSMIAALGAWELFRIARSGGTLPLEGVGVALAASIPLLVHAHVLRVFVLPASVIAIAVLGVLASALWLRGVAGKPLAAVAITVFGAAYTGGMMSFAYLLRYHDYAVGQRAGTALLALPLVITWATDIGAYAVGRMFGQAKLMPSVSPGKTIAGAIGGLVAAVVSCAIFAHFVLRPVAQLGLSPAGILVFGVAVSVAAQIGDLAESMLKREAGVKDSSHIIPGHGGILDRFDSLLFVLPVAYLMLGWLLLPAPR